MTAMATRRHFMRLRIAIRRWLRSRNERRLKVDMGWRDGWSWARKECR